MVFSQERVRLFAAFTPLSSYLHGGRRLDVLNDYADGMYSTDIIWDDTNLHQLENLPEESARLTDSLVVKADEQGASRRSASPSPTLLI